MKWRYTVHKFSKTNKWHQGILQTPRKINTEKSVPNHIIEKLIETKKKEKNILNQQEKMTYYSKEQWKW